MLAAQPNITSDAIHHIDVYGCSDAGQWGGRGDPGFSRRGERPIPKRGAPTYYFDHFSTKTAFILFPFSEYSAIQHLFTEGADCGGLASMHCATMIGAWTVGYPGTCMNGGNYGFRIGQNAFRWALAEVKGHVAV